jgi:hypothetical protein
MFQFIYSHFYDVHIYIRIKQSFVSTVQPTLASLAKWLREEKSFLPHLMQILIDFILTQPYLSQKNTSLLHQH